GVPESAKERTGIIQRIVDEGLAMGINKDQILVDGLVMSVSSNQNAAIETLKVIRWCTETAELAALAGLSNVSFGLPERGYINGAFLAMGIANGLCMAIANPSSEIIGYIKAACDVLTGKDKNSSDYISKYGATTERIQKTEEKRNLPTGERISQCVLEGDRDSINELLDRSISEGILPRDIVDNYLVPAINKVGRYYEEGKYFLPQLIQSAEVMQAAFGYLSPYLSKATEEKGVRAPVAVLATVKGDIHDIGKNIVALMLRNSGFTVHDLGKNVESKVIIEAAKEHQAQIIGLSALLTTTMIEMKTVADLIKEEQLNVKLMVGGAVVTANYAKEIGADGYAKDAYEAVKLAKQLCGISV
ncbi:MAG: cobalamin-dependent protein, partial [Peptococcaceae bacterium]|nr:cobalamin-dependent protein [Peptococcaceae bacterium]